MSRHVYKIGDSNPGFVGVHLGADPPAGLTDPCAATLSQFTDLDVSCQAVSADLAVNVSTNTSEIPGVYCEPQPLVSQGAPTEEWTANMELLMDEDLATGVAAFMMENSSQVAWIIMGEHAATPGDPTVPGAPQFVAKVRLVSPTLMGAPGEVRQVSVGLAVDGKPYACFGRPGNTRSVNTIDDPNNVTAQHPTVTGADAADLVTLKASGTIGDGNYTGPAFTTDQYVVLGDGSQAHYTAAAWSVGPMP